jgi:hypothetical protein
MQQMEATPAEYKKKMDMFLKAIPDCMYVFEMTKLCGYSEFLLMYKEAPISDIYKSITYRFGSTPRLFFMKEDTKQQYQLPNTEIFTVREMINKLYNNVETNGMIKPVYADLDSLVVYRLFYDDGHTHGCCNQPPKKA